MSHVKNRRRRNVFKQDESQNLQIDSIITNNQQQLIGELQNNYDKNAKQKMNPNKFQDFYDQKFASKKLQENKMYYGQKQQDNRNQVNNFLDQENTKKAQGQEQEQKLELRKQKKRGRRKQRQFFDIQGEQQDNNKQKQAVQSVYINKIQGQQYQQKSGLNQQIQEPSSQDQKAVKKMIENKNSLIKEIPKQIIVSFKTLLDAAGNDKQLKKRIYYSPLATKEKACCYFKRYQTGLTETYQLIGDDHRPLLFCQNQRGSIGANMYISLNKEMDKNSSSYLGKLRGNASGSEYILYDCGQTPNSKLDRSKWRISMASIQYQSNFMGWKGPRKLKVVTPRVQSEDEWDSYKLAQDEVLTKLPDSLTIAYRNKQPKWNQKLKSYALNFGGRVKMASIKNFILVDAKHQVEQQLAAPSTLVFGKVDQNTFSLQFNHPLSLFQAFGVTMSAFDFKINCQ